MKKTVTIICVDGWKYTGIKSKELISPIGKLQWLELETKKGHVKINAEYIVSIIT